MLKQEILRMVQAELPGYDVGGLRDIHLYIEKGGKMVVIGLSGAGKTLFYEYFSGHLPLKSGRVLFDGKICPESETFPFAEQVFCLGRGSTLVDSLTIAENIFILNRKCKGYHPVRKKNIFYRARLLLGRYVPELSPEMKVRELSVSQKKMVELLRAIEYEAKMVVIDDVFQGFGHLEKKKISELLGVLQEKNIAILYLCHERDSFVQGAFRVAVLRKGEIVRTFYEETYRDDLCRRYLLGADEPENFQKYSYKTTDEMLHVERAALFPLLPLRYITVKRGEIAGFYDMENRYNVQFLKKILGLEEHADIFMRLQGKKYDPSDFSDAQKADVLLMPSFRDRQTHLVGTLDFADNLSLPILAKEARRHPFCRTEIAHFLEREYGDILGIGPERRRQKVREFDPYTRERILLQSLILHRPKLLICLESYSAVDIFMKKMIFNALKEMSKNGTTILMASQNMNELRTVSDTIYVMNEDIWREDAGEIMRYEL